MRKTIFALLWGIAVLGPGEIAQGQSVPLARDIVSPATPPDSETEIVRLTQPYKSVCAEIRAGKFADDSPLRELPPADIFRAAIIRFCTQGDFVLTAPRNQDRCEYYYKFELKHRIFILALATMREEPVRRIIFECVQVDAQLRLEFRTLDATVFIFRKVIADEVYVYFSKLLNGIRIEDSEIRAGLRFNGVTATGPIIIAKTKIGLIREGRSTSRSRPRNTSFYIRNSNLNSILIESITFDGHVSFENISTKEDVSFKDSTISGDLDAQGEKIGGRLLIEGGKIIGSIHLERVSADGILLKNITLNEIYLNYAKIGKTLELDGVTTSGRADLNHVRVEGSLRVSNKSSFAKPFSLDHAVIEGQVVVESSMFADYLQAIRAQVHHFEIKHAEVSPSLVLTGIAARDLIVHDTTVKDWFYIANARLNTLDILRSKFGRLDCSDCVIDQYAILAAEYREGARLSGARILGSLIFSTQYPPNRTYRSTWLSGSVLDLTGAKAQSVQANDEDLRIQGLPRDCRNQLVKVNLSGFTFDQFIGRRYMDLHPATGQDESLFNRQVDELRNWIRGRPSCWSVSVVPQFRGGNYQAFDPQPFETFATALERAGRSRQAVDLRIAKREEEIAASERPFYERFYLEVGRWLVAYGYKNELALLWLVALVMIGTIVYLRSSAASLVGRENVFDRFFYSLFFSIDRLVPQLIVHGEMSEFEGMGRLTTYYFYAHRVLGALILIYAVAGLTGVLK